MLFWILTGIAIAIPIIVFAWTIIDGYYDGVEVFLNVMLATIISGIVWGLVAALGLGWWATSTGTIEKVGTETRDLAALSTDTALEGHRYFLGRSWLHEDQVITYVYEQEDGAFRLTRADAADSYIYEDEEDAPYVQIDDYEYFTNPWISPLNLGVGATDVYMFHVPEGSVLSDYEVAP